MTAAGVEALLQAPEQIVVAFGLRHQQGVQVQPPGAERRAVGPLRRVEPDLPAFVRVAEPGQGRQQQAQLAQARPVQQQLGERAHRPAAAGQFGVEFGVTAGVRRRPGPAPMLARPDAPVTGQRVQGGHGNSESKKLYEYTV